MISLITSSRTDLSALKQQKFSPKRQWNWIKKEIKWQKTGQWKLPWLTGSEIRFLEKFASSAPFMALCHVK